MALGKNLENIIGDYFGDEEVQLNPPEQVSGVAEVKISDIELSPYQTRKHFDADKIKGLATSVKRSGLLNPITLIKKGKKYVLLAGERRLRAFKELGKKSIPAIIKDDTKMSEKDKYVLATSENLHRENLNPIELARTFQILLEKDNIDITKLAKTLGTSEQYVKNYMNLLDMNPKVVEVLENGQLKEGVARQLVSVPKVDQPKLMKEVMEQKLSVRATIDLVKKYKAAKNPKTQNGKTVWAHSLPRHVVHQLDRIADEFPDADIQARGDETKGRIVINWG